MICDKLFCLVLVLTWTCVGIAQNMQSDGGDEEQQDECSLWKPGMRYQTTIRYDFTVKNCEIKLGKGYDVENGAYTSPQITFRPIVVYVTEDIRRHGHNYSGMRTYAKPVVTLKGVGNLRWETTSSLVSWRRWAAWASRTHAAEWIAKKIGMEETVRMADFAKMVDKDQTTEEYVPFALSNDAVDGTDFDVAKEALFLEWSDRTFRQRGGDRLRVYIGNRGSDSSDVNAVRSLAPEAITDVIRSEGDVSASAIFDRPGRGLALDPDRRVWTIDAGAINGLIQNDKLRKLINFRGTMTVRRKKIDMDEIRAKKMAPFDGTCVTVIDSSNMVVGYDTDQAAGNFQVFPVDIGENSDSSIEFWFDNVNETLRYAKVKIVNHEYEGNIPNPRLGQNISRVRGRAKGDMSFVCVYTTEIQNKTYVLPPEQIMGKDSGCVLKRFAKDRYLSEIRGRDLAAVESSNLYCWPAPDGGECNPDRSLKFKHIACHEDWCEFRAAKNDHQYDAWSKDGRIYLQERLPKNVSGDEYEFLLSECRLPMRRIRVPDLKSERNDAEVSFIKCAMPNGREYWLGETEVTQELWGLVMNKNPSEFVSLDRPVDNVSWSNAVVFCRNMSHLVGQTVRLPTVDEWWNACRSGRTVSPIASVAFSYNAPELSDSAWYGGNSTMGFRLKKGFDASCFPSRQYSAAKWAGTHPVGKKKCNQWGFFDMFGNVAEICCEEDGRDVSSSGVVTLFGGSWRDCAGVCVSEDGLKWPWKIGNGMTGIRLVLIPNQKKAHKVRHVCIFKSLTEGDVFPDESEEYKLKRIGSRIRFWIDGEENKPYSPNVCELEHESCQDESCVMKDKNGVKWNAVLVSRRLTLSKHVSGHNLRATYVFSVGQDGITTATADANVADVDESVPNGDFSLVMARQGDAFYEKKLWDPAVRCYWQSEEVLAKIRAAEILRLGLPGVHKNFEQAISAYLYAGVHGDAKALLQGVLYQSLLMRRRCCAAKSYADKLKVELSKNGKRCIDLRALGEYADFRWYSESNFRDSYDSFVSRMKEIGLSAPAPSSPERCYAILDTEGLFSPMSGVLLAENGIYVINGEKGSCQNGFIAWDRFFQNVSLGLCNKGRDWAILGKMEKIGINDIGSWPMIRAFLYVTKYFYDEHCAAAKGIKTEEHVTGENTKGVATSNTVGSHTLLPKGSGIAVRVDGETLTFGQLYADVDAIIKTRAAEIPTEQVDSVRRQLAKQVIQGFMVEKTLVANARNEGLVVTDEDREKRERVFLAEVAKKHDSPRTLQEYMEKFPLGARRARAEFENGILIDKLIGMAQVKDDAKDYVSKAKEIVASIARSNHVAEVESASALARMRELQRQLENVSPAEIQMAFARLAKKYSECPSSAHGGDLGEFAHGMMVKEFEEVAFSLPVGKVSSPVRTPFGYHLILVTKRIFAREGVEALPEKVHASHILIKARQACCEAPVPTEAEVVAYLKKKDEKAFAQKYVAAAVRAADVDVAEEFRECLPDD